MTYKSRVEGTSSDELVGVKELKDNYAMHMEKAMVFTEQIRESIRKLNEEIPNHNIHISNGLGSIKLTDNITINFQFDDPKKMNLE